MGILNALAKNWKLMRIMRRIGKPHSIADLAEQVISREPSDAKKAERELFDLVCTNRETRAILEHYGVTRADIEACYGRLSAMGQGRWIRGNYVAAAAIALKPTLIYLLEATNAPLPDGWTEEDRWIKIVFDLVRYFESGSLGAVSSGFKPRGVPPHPAAPIVTDSTLAKMPRMISIPDSLSAQLALPSFNKETYAKAKPYFQAAYNEFVAAGKSLKDFVRWAVSSFGANIRPYLQQYHRDLAGSGDKETGMDVAATIKAQAHKPTMDLMEKELPRVESLFEQCPPKHPERPKLTRALTLFYGQLNRMVAAAAMTMGYPLRQWEWPDSRPLEAVARAYPDLGLETSEWYQRFLGTIVMPPQPIPMWWNLAIHEEVINPPPPGRAARQPEGQPKIKFPISEGSSSPGAKGKGIETSSCVLRKTQPNRPAMPA